MKKAESGGVGVGGRVYRSCVHRHDRDGVLIADGNVRGGQREANQALHAAAGAMLGGRGRTPVR